MAGQRSSGARINRVLGVTPHPGTGLEVTGLELQNTLEPISDEQRVAALDDALASTSADKRRLINRARDRIETYADSLTIMNIGDTVAKIEQVYSSNILRFTSVFVMTPVASTTVLLSFANGRVISGPSGYWPLSPCTIIHKPDEPVSLTVSPAITVAGSGWLWLQGEQLPEVDF